MKTPKLPLVVLVAIAALGGTACSADTEAAAPAAEEDVVSAARLEVIESPPALVHAAATAAEASGGILQVASYRYDAARLKDPARVIAAVRAKLPHAKLRQDEGAVDAAVADATLEEYGVTGGEKDALVAALRTAVGDKATSKKFWLRSDDVPNADSEWAEVVFVYVVPDTQRVVQLTIRYEA